MAAQPDPLADAEVPYVRAIDRAHAIARAVHEAQRYQGKDYYEHHVLPVAEAVRHHGPVIYIAALLHDVIEDSAGPAARRPYDAPTLLDAGIPAASVSIVVAVSRVPGEAYSALIERAAATRDSAIVKWSDNRRNLDACIQDGNSGLAKRYLKFGQVLAEALAGHGLEPGRVLSR